MLTFTCPYCNATLRATLDTSGDMPVGVLPSCDCSEARAAWETQHRAAMEQRKRARVPQEKLIYAGRTTRSKARKR